MQQVIQLSSHLASDAEVVGYKAASLSRLVRSGFRVPRGWCLPARVHRVVRSVDYSIAGLPDLRKPFDELLRHSISGTLIVRSSGLIEDGNEVLFPGIFRSIRDITTYDDLRLAIITCMQSAESKMVRAYSRIHGLPAGSLEIAVLVQEQLLPDYAGVAFSRSPLHDVELTNGTQSVLIEMSRGGSSRLLAGGRVGAAFAVTQVRGVFCVTTLTDCEGQAVDPVRHIICDVAGVAMEAERAFGTPQDVEWAAVGQRVYVVQSRKIPSRTQRRLLSPAPQPVASVSQGSVLPEEAEVGLKGAAMLLFSDIGLFHQPVAFLRPHGNFEAFAETLASAMRDVSGITVRFSHRDDIGLPRFFSASVQDAIRRLRRMWKPGWLAIVHPYMDVSRSFELYLAADHWVLEHVPGVWESDTGVSPDVIIDTPDTLRVLRFRETRVGKLLSPNGRTNVMSEPEPLDTLLTWARWLRPVVVALRERLSHALPLNIHFVSDSAAQWQFLNIRRTKPISPAFLQRGHFHVVSEEADVQQWDGHKPLLIAITVERGQEASIIDIISALPPSVKTVYVSFGVMSHPAMVLREQGIETIPAYSSHDLFDFAEGGGSEQLPALSEA